MTSTADTGPGGRRVAVAAAVGEYVQTVGALGILLYGLLRLAYVFFYTRLRTTPEEVGYGYARILSESIAGAVELTVIATVLVALLTVLYSLARTAPDLMRARKRGWTSMLARVRRVPGLAVRRLVVRSLVAGFLLVIASLPPLAWWQGGLARGGQTVRNAYFVGVPYLPVLAVQAVPADVAWIDGDEGKPLPLAGRTFMLYLGEANGVTVFYEVPTALSIRLPSAEITVTLRYAYSVPDECRYG